MFIPTVTDGKSATLSAVINVNDFVTSRKIIILNILKKYNNLFVIFFALIM